MITFVCGVPCSGKSYYIEHNFPNIKKLDIYDYQRKLKFHTVQNMLDCQSQALEDLIEAAKHEDVIMEHTLLKKMRRDEQITRIRAGGYAGEIRMIFLNPSKDILRERAKIAGVPYDYVDGHLEILELPTVDEGFDSVTIIN